MGTSVKGVAGPARQDRDRLDERLDRAPRPASTTGTWTRLGAECSALLLCHADSLHLREAAIDEQLDSGDEAGVVRRQEHGRPRDVIAAPEPAQRHTGSEALEEIRPSLRGADLGPANLPCRSGRGLSHRPVFDGP